MRQRPDVTHYARMVELVDTRDLKSLGSNTVPVQVRSPAPRAVKCGAFCRRDGIGRRAGLKIRSWRQGAGSTPAAGTKSSSILMGFLFLSEIIDFS